MAEAKTPFPLIPTMRAAIGDVFSRFSVFLRVIGFLWISQLIFVDVPTLFVSESITSAIHEKVKAISGERGLEELGENPLKILSREDMRGIVRFEHLLINTGLSLIQMALIFCFITGWYRQLLLDENRDKPLSPRFGRHEWDLSWTGMKAGLLVSPIMIVMLGYILAAAPQMVGETGGQPASMAEVIPVVLVCVLIMVYLQSRFAMAYPLTTLGKKEKAILASWVMTKGYGGILSAGNVLVLLPIIIGMVAVTMLLSFLMQQMGLNVSGSLLDRESSGSAFFPQLILRGIGGLFTFIILGVLTAFHARVYAFFVRSAASKNSAA